MENAETMSTDQNRGTQTKGNHLLGQRSQYLLQHAHNPVDWYPWGDEALNRAKHEDKPIFLSIGYSSCHWCHVMEEEVFEDRQVADYLNRHYVSIKVDREQRPDLDGVYMRAVQVLNGSGGWPLSVFLTPDKKPFFGGTYFPRAQFLTLIQSIQSVYRQKRTLIESQATEVTGHITKDLDSAHEQIIDQDKLNHTILDSMRTFDQRWGGLSTRMKFPTPMVWMFLLHMYRKTGSTQAGHMVQTTLNHMGSGGIHDHIDGGFHRYATEPTWLVPHFEKMLYDNALLAALYLEASVIFKNPRYQQIAVDTLDFMIREMSGDEGGFYSSSDADSEGKEGKFYLWTEQEIVQVAGEQEGHLLARVLGVTTDGNFEGKNILTRRMENFEKAGSEQMLLFEKHRSALRAYRKMRTPPALDRKIITSWNGLAIAALARCAAVLQRPDYRKAAEKAAEFIWQHHRKKDGSLFRVSNQKQTEQQGVLDDYTFYTHGLLELYGATGNLRHLRRALALIEFVRNHFAHPKGGFYFTPKDNPTPLGRHLEIMDNAVPSGNAMMLHTLLRAGALCDRTAYRNEVKRTLRAYSGPMQRFGLDMAWWHDVALLYRGPFYEVVVAGDARKKDHRQLVTIVQSLALPNAVLALVPAKGPTPETAKLLPPTDKKTSQKGKTTAYVCQLGNCQLPTSDPSKLREQLLGGWKH